MKTYQIRGPNAAFKIIAICSLASVLIVAAVAGPTYTGSLSTGSGLTGTGDWAQNASLSWSIEDKGTYWNYDYTLTVPRKDISHFILGVSDSFDYNNIWDENALQAAFGSIEIQTYTPGGSNPGLPGNLYGIKFDDVGPAAGEDEALVLQVNFNSDRNPVWQDFYGKGAQNGIWNDGFLTPNPTDAPSNGSNAYHILAPDTTTIVPVPGAVMLALIGMGCVPAIRRKLN